LTHCGWGSVTEALQFGLALIILPFLTDTRIDSKVFGREETGVEVPRNEEDGSFTRESVAKTLRLAIKDVEGKIYRDNAKEMATIFGDMNLQFTYVDKFVEFLESRRRVREG
jgi:UDP:flavonoid glycosyltransferase YjiC (YdhE family)